MARRCLLIAFAAALVLACQGARLSDETGDWTPPDWCRNKDCPQFEVLKTADNVELRRYRPANWVSTNITNTKFDDAWTAGTKTLDSYFKGDNVDEQKLGATNPTMMLLYPSQEGRVFDSRFTLEYFVPFELQDKPPAPKAQEVNIVHVPKEDVWVRIFGGYAKEQDIVQQTFDFIDDLKKQGIDVMTEVTGFAQYDDPIHLINRHNEIWVFPKEQPSPSSLRNAAEKVVDTIARAWDHVKGGSGH